MRLATLFILLLLLVSPAFADVELARKGKRPVLLTEVYQHQGEPFMALDEVLDAVGLRGDWDSVRHIYRFRSPAGKASLSPGSRYLKLGDFRFDLKTRPRFIDSRLRVGEDFILEQLPRLTGSEIYYRNLSPAVERPGSAESATERLFSFLTRRKVRSPESGVRSILIDAGHGGSDAGSLVRGAPAEKEIVLSVGQSLARRLKMDLGATADLTRTGDYDLSAEQRLDLLTQSNVDLYLSLHVQTGFSTKSQGVSFSIPPSGAFYDPQAETRSLVLVEKMTEALQKQGFTVQGLYRPALLGLSSVATPSIHVELGYLSHEIDLETLSSAQGQERIVGALFDGIRNYSDTLKENSR